MSIGKNKSTDESMTAEDYVKAIERYSLKLCKNFVGV
jgi:hypothetical protein